MSWALEALAALKRIVLLEERITNLMGESKMLMDTCKNLDRRLHRLEAKFELIEHLASAHERALPSPARELKHRKKKD